MNKQDVILARRHLRKENAKYSPKLQIVPERDWPASTRTMETLPDVVYRSRFYLVQLFRTDPVRLSICRAEIASDGNFKDGLSWDELQAIKEQIYPGRDAVEIYPVQKNVVNVANFRHLWIMKEPVEFAWRTKE